MPFLEMIDEFFDFILGKYSDDLKPFVWIALIIGLIGAFIYYSPSVNTGGDVQVEKVINE